MHSLISGKDQILLHTWKQQKRITIWLQLSNDLLTDSLENPSWILQFSVKKNLISVFLITQNYHTTSEALAVWTTFWYFYFYGAFEYFLKLQSFSPHLL